MELRRKQIDIKPETFKLLSIQAAEVGTNLKKYIENLLDAIAMDSAKEDLHLFNKKVKNNPESWEMLNSKEKAEFEKEMGICK